MTDVQNQDHGIELQTSRTDGTQDIIRISRIDLEAPWRWLSAGLSDLLAMPTISLTYGAVFAAIAVGLWFGLAMLGYQSLMLALAGGFMIIGPILAVGLYEGSRRLELGQKVKLSDVALAGFKTPTQLSLLGLALLIIYIVWIRMAFLLFMVSFGTRPFPPIEEFIPTLLFSLEGIALLSIGTIIGAVLAAVAFSISVVSAPMLLARPVGVTTAIFASVRATTLNIKPMALWAVLIAAFIAIGLATLSIGLIVIFPLIGHATWHAYREILEQKS